jgi:uncharacterized protein (DUF849 family)
MAEKKSSANKVIVSCAITGSIHTPTMSDALPYRPEDIAAQAIGAAEAGAAILHLHARDPANGRPSGDPALATAFCRPSNNRPTRSSTSRRAATS